MNKKKLYKQSRQRNMNEERYHGPLITNEVVLGYIKIYPWINLFFSILLVGIGLKGWYSDYYGVIRGVFTTCVVINLLGIILSFFHDLINQFKSLTYILIALVVGTNILWLDFIGMTLFLSKNNSTIPSDFSSEKVLFYTIPLIFLFIFSTALYSWYYLPKNQGKIWAFNRWETYGGKEKGKKQELLFNFGVAFVAVILVPAILTGYIENVFGISFGLLITVTLPAVMVDAVYAAIYIRKHPDYDELE